MEIKSIDKYSYTCWLFKNDNFVKYALSDYFTGHTKDLHSHHIKPKSLYPEEKNNYQNIVRLPPLLHAVVHFWFYDYLIETKQNDIAEKLNVSNNIIEYINNTLLKDNRYQYDCEQIKLYADLYWDFIIKASKTIKYFKSIEDFDFRYRLAYSTQSLNYYINPKRCKNKDKLLTIEQANNLNKEFKDQYEDLLLLMKLSDILLTQYGKDNNESLGSIMFKSVSKIQSLLLYNE